MPADQIPPEIPPMIERMLDHWEVAGADRAVILQIACANREIAGGFLQIHARLKSLFPKNLALGYAWMARSNAGFGGERPLDVILTRGEQGVEDVKRYLFV